ncbi:hypothetical protein ADN00_17150 [Ornatilinea apprima]|uniref:Uncharacterized protein n=1 Tax=Ornatilinea apprima TaxID=1134406 RepID=A0A0N8GL38_9CHLR|nr:hypothetical protein [Ornatilinea apprima]KPL71418.1 hypothetical protein ADN00_17150 [Ornatilinea apprima]
MTKITSGLLNDTLNLIQLARETALRSGRQAQASRFAPVEQNLQKAVTTARENRVAAPSQSGMMGQKDFKTLLNLSQNGGSHQASSMQIGERNQMVRAMASGGMSDLDIARQLGMTRQEVRLVVSVQRQMAYGKYEVSA